MDALLPIWIIGAPFLLAIIEKIRTPKASTANGAYDRQTPYTAPRVSPA